MLLWFAFEYWKIHKDFVRAQWRLFCIFVHRYILWIFMYRTFGRWPHFLCLSRVVNSIPSFDLSQHVKFYAIEADDQWRQQRFAYGRIVRNFIWHLARRKTYTSKQLILTSNICGAGNLGNLLWDFQNIILVVEFYNISRISSDSTDDSLGEKIETMYENYGKW